MALADLTQLELLIGSFALIWVIFATIIGLRIIWKAISLKRNELITVGLSWILLASAWWGVALQFITYGFFNYKLTAFQYLLVANVLLPIAITCWIYSFCQILNPDLKKSLLVVYIIVCAIWEIYLIVGLSINTEIVATIEGTFDSKHTTVSLIFVFFAILSFLITGVIFSIKSMKVDDPEIKWKGRFLLLAWILFTVGALLDAAISPAPVTLIIVRLILITSSIFFYLGFFLPEFIKKSLIK